MYFADALTLDAPRTIKGGYIAVRARAARVGVYQYAGYEIDPSNEHGLRDTALVNVLRDDATVFDAAAVRSFIGKPVTNDHPSVAVTADNWRDHARGTIMGAMRDGDYLAFDLLLTDKAAIDAVNAGKRGLSNGYAAELQFGDFKAPDGTACQARQTKITDGNHVALVDQGRAGPDCRIADAQPWAICDANTAALAAFTTEKEPAMAGTITIDGLPVSLADEKAVLAVLDKKDKAIADAATALADEQAKVATLTAKKAALEKQLADAQAELEPASIERRVADRAALIGKAKAIKADIVTDGRTDADIRAEIVGQSLGDAAKDFTADQFAAAFAVLAKDAKPVSDSKPNVVNITPTKMADTASVRDLVRAARY